MKYCIGCQHLSMSAYEGSMYDTGYGHAANIHCARNHWEVTCDDYAVDDLEAAMEKAETCPDYVERATPV